MLVPLLVVLLVAIGHFLLRGILQRSSLLPLTPQVAPFQDQVAARAPLLKVSPDVNSELKLGGDPCIHCGISF